MVVVWVVSWQGWLHTVLTSWSQPSSNPERWGGNVGKNSIPKCKINTLQRQGWSHWFISYDSYKHELWYHYGIERIQFLYNGSLSRTEEVVITRLRIGHQSPYLGPWTPNYLPPLWTDTDNWPYAPGLRSDTGKSWWIQHGWLIEYPLQNNSQDLYNGIPTRSGILRSDMNGQTLYKIPN